MTLRDFFAAHAIMKARAARSSGIRSYEQRIASSAYAIADAMIQERA